MIKTISDFLLQLKNREVELLKTFSSIKHPGIIGSMYEGLTKSILEKSIFDGLDIRVTSGKIKNAFTQKYSAEIDCMIVIGEGIKIPYTDKYIYDSKQVIAVIEVKKNLYKKDIQDSYENLRSVIATSEYRNLEKYHLNQLRIAFKSICNEELPSREEVELLPREKQLIYHTLLLETFYPIRITFGYNGYKSESALREAFWSFLEDNKSEGEKIIKGFGALSFPNLIVCDKYSLLKGNGMPYSVPLYKDKWWLLYFSTDDNPFYLLMELIWTRLSFMFELDSSIFGDDLIIDQVHGFIGGKYIEPEGKKGWAYFFIPIDEEQLAIPLIKSDWEPVFLTEQQYIIVQKAGTVGNVYLDDKLLLDVVKKAGVSIEDFLDELKGTGLIQIKNCEIKLITESCLAGMYKGKYFAGENSSGRVTRWINKVSKNQ